MFASVQFVCHLVISILVVICPFPVNLCHSGFVRLKAYVFSL